MPLAVSWPRAIVSLEDFVNGGKKSAELSESRCGLGVDGKLELGRLLDRNIARFCAAENFVHWGPTRVSMSFLAALSMSVISYRQTENAMPQPVPAAER
jgi:hypothetical protein